MQRSPRSSRSGIALVLVLAFLAIITAIIFAFFSTATNELNMSDAAVSSASADQLADSAVNVAMAQVVSATKGAENKEPLAWASQPGMIRTYDSTGKPKYCFKLYSSDQMVIDGTKLDLATELPPNNWNSPENLELYTDLNAPAFNSQKAKELVYPILDPDADGTVPPGSPATTEKFKVEGFTVGKAPGYTVGVDASIANNRAAMPVKWLYVLKDGTLKAPEMVGDILKVPGATDANPITGRVAFWCDDESGKVNINTASEGTYWDMPRIYSMEDFGAMTGTSLVTPGLASCQPRQHEYQRYPGHPATTCLSTVFGSLFPVPYPFPLNPSAADSLKLDVYYNLAPRIGLPNLGGGGGSNGGRAVVAGGSPMTVDQDRLYGSVDELMFTPSLVGTGERQRIYSLATVAPITRTALEKAKFFLTANSMAPETTLFNTPRISIWPVWNTASKRTAFDKLSAFCATVGTGNNSPYYFTRSNPRSSSDDFTGRNEALYRYLQAATRTPIPGFGGGNFQAKYPRSTSVPPMEATDCDQVLTSIFDYIRSANLQDKSTGAVPFTPIFDKANYIPGAGEVIPIRIDNTQGFGRFYTFSEASIILYGTPQQPDKVEKMRAVFVLMFATPGQAQGPLRAKVKYRVTGLDKFQISQQGSGTTQSLNFKNTGVNYMDSADIECLHGRSIGGTECPTQAMLSKPFADADAGGNAHKKYPFFSSADIPLAKGSRLVDFIGNSADPSDCVTVEILTDEVPEAKSQVIQTFRLQFPSSTFKLAPALAGTSRFGTRNLQSTYNLVMSDDTAFGVQVAGVVRGGTAGAGRGNDSTAGDTRMIASLKNVPVERMRPHQNYLSDAAGSPVQYAHGLMMSIGDLMTGGTYGKLVPVSSYKQVSNTYRQPDVPSRVGEFVTRADGGPGDWDTGWGDQKDGAHINKPDEGDSKFGDTQGSNTRIPYSLGYGQGYAAGDNAFFSPTRQMPSPMMFGSLPTGVQRNLPWQTLSFAPRPEDLTHPGNQGVKDHLLADLFWMPVVEPWAISQPMATAGKINMNYQIMPFTYIKRQTGLHAVMKAMRFMAIPLTDVPNYKPLDPFGGGYNRVADGRRRSIDIPATLGAFDTKFSSGEIFRSATQICEMNLVAQGESLNSMAQFWRNNRLTGDNLREKPYVDLYPRLTTKSNTFTVHVRAQALRKVKGTPADQWDRKRDRVLGEYRGSSIIERYIDPNDPSLPDFAAEFTSNPSTPANIDKYYRLRVVSTKRFAP